MEYNMKIKHGYKAQITPLAPQIAVEQMQESASDMINQKLDSIMQARSELFENKISQGMTAHSKFLKSLDLVK